MQLLADLRKVGVASSIHTQKANTHGPPVQVNFASEIGARDLGFWHPIASLKP
jgi:hypothetical protein